MVPILISLSHQKDPRTGRDRHDDAGGPGTARRRVGVTLCAEDEFADLLIRLRGGTRGHPSIVFAATSEWRF